MRKSYRKPRNPQDFEELCRRLLETLWNSPKVELYGTNGEAQNGVDIIDLSGRKDLHVAQCKWYEEGKKMTPAEVKGEIEKAKKFPTPIKHYLIMTTDKVRKAVQILQLQINEEHREKGLFKVKIFGWKRIEKLLDDYPDVRNWYENEGPSSSEPRIESKLDELKEIVLRALPDQSQNDHNQDKFHLEIDEAKNCLEKHDYQLANLLLLRIKSRNWDQLNDRHKFRVLTNLAFVEMSSDKPKEAARLYLEAKDYQPNDKIARANEAFAYLLLEQQEKAFELAGKLREKFPRSGFVLGIFIQSAPGSTKLAALEKMATGNLLVEDYDYVEHALAERALNYGEIQKAEDFVRSAITKNSSTPRLWLLLGAILLESERQKITTDPELETSLCDPERLSEAEGALSKAVELAKKRHLTSEIAAALLRRSQVKKLLKKNAEARKDLDEARQTAPQNPSVIEAYAISLGSEEKHNEAIDFLQKLLPNSLSNHGRMCLGVFLLDRGCSGDAISAAKILAHVARSEEKLPEDFRYKCVEFAFQAFDKEKQFDAANELLGKLPKETISQVSIETLTARLHLLEGNQDEALKNAEAALLALKQDVTISAFKVRHLADLLMTLRRFDDSLVLWQQIAVPNVLNLDIRNLLECASRLNRDDIMLETFKKLRQAKVFIDRKLLDSELSLLHKYDTDRTIEILEQEIKQRPDDKELKLKLSIMGLVLDRADLINQDLSSIPAFDKVEPQIAVGAVRVLKKIGEEQYAVRYAYEVLRHNFQDPDAHTAFILALSPFENEPSLEKPDCVDIDTAVRYTEQGVSDPNWIIIEAKTNRNSPFLEHEYSPNDTIYKEIKGKRVGDTFVLASGMQNRIGKILEIQNKYLHRYQNCIEKWQIRFPESPRMQWIKLTKKSGKSGESMPDMSPLLEIINKKHEDLTKFEQIYKKDNRLSAHIFGRFLGLNTVEALHHLALQNEIPVRCCYNSLEEDKQAKKALRSCDTIVLDISAIASLFLLNRLDLLEHCPIDLMISQNTLVQIQKMIANKVYNPSGYLVNTESGHVFKESTAKQQNEHIDRLRNLVNLIKDNCKIVPCEELAKMESDKREMFSNLFELYGTEALILSTVPGRVLWTDDLTQAEIARNEYKVSRVWTQLVVEKHVESGIFDLKTFFDISAKLVGYGYETTGINPQIIRQAGILADWDINRWPLSQALSIFTKESVELKGLLLVAGEFLRLLYLESLQPITKTNITVRILENISERKGGIQGINDLRRSLPNIFSLDIVGLENAVKNIDAWLKNSNKKSLLL